MGVTWCCSYAVDAVDAVDVVDAVDAVDAVVVIGEDVGVFIHMRHPCLGVRKDMFTIDDSDFTVSW